MTAVPPPFAPALAPALALWPWERATGVQDAALPGVVSGRYLTLLTVVAAGILWVFLAGHGAWGVLLALVLGRMVALDLVAYVLPDIYTLPLLVVGVAALYGRAFGGVVLPIYAVEGALMLMALWAGMEWFLPRARWGMGGGDWKLAVAMVVHMGVFAALWGFVFGCLVLLPLAFFRPRQALPLGVALAIGFAVGDWIQYDMLASLGIF